MRLVPLLAFCAVLSAQTSPAIRLHRVAGGFPQITDVVEVPDGSRRVLVLEQRGTIRALRYGTPEPTAFLDWTRRVSCCGERGLLGIAFPPGFEAKRYFYINYTDPQGTSVISRIRLNAEGVGDPASEQVILRIAQPFPNHNGGGLAFGPDGYLYIGTGDGGSGDDPQDAGQRTDTLLGKMLRIDTEAAGVEAYAVPASNPFVGRSNYRAEIWATGLRNPWRYSFDRETGDLWIADVGQNRAEEVNFQAASSRGGENYGWRIMEGLQCRTGPGTCSQEGLTLPLVEYGRDLGVSVTGGFVYRGSRYPALRGIYLYADFGSGRIWGLQRIAGRWESRELLDSPEQISTFGQDQSGEIYVGGYGGNLFLLTAGAPSVTANGVVNAASFGAGLVPGSLATVFGSGITSWNGIAGAAAFPIATELSGVSVTMNGTRVPIVAVASANGQEQINFQVPFELAGANRATLVVNANGASSAPVEVLIASVQPEIFAVTRSQGAITIWATGLGAVSNAPATGQAAPVSPLAATIADTQVTVNGNPVPVTYSGLSPQFAGLYQVNATTVASGEVVLRVGGVSSRPFRLQ